MSHLWVLKAKNSNRLWWDIESWSRVVLSPRWWFKQIEPSCPPRSVEIDGATLPNPAVAARFGSVKCWLKYGFCKKYFRKNEPLTSWTLFSPVFFQISTESALIWKKTGEKSVQLVRGSFFRKYFLWNPYFSSDISYKRHIKKYKRQVSCYRFGCIFSIGAHSMYITAIYTNLVGTSQCFHLCAETLGERIE